MTEISKGLLKAYKNTDFIVFNGQDAFTLRIGKKSEELDQVLKKNKKLSACYITAWNPLSKELTPSRNQIRQNSMIRIVKQKGFSILHGIGRSKDHKYHEDSILVLGCSKELSIFLGKKFKQNAVIYYELGSTVELLLLR